MVKTFRVFGWLEGLSFLILLGIAMPLKYHWGMPQAVRVVGMIHGLLFLGYIGSAFAVYDRNNWPLNKLGLAVLAAFLPFGPFVFNSRVHD